MPVLQVKTLPYGSTTPIDSMQVRLQYLILVIKPDAAFRYFPRLRS
jgi:hypothetical protein